VSSCFELVEFDPLCCQMALELMKQLHFSGMESQIGSLLTEKYEEY